MTNIGIDALDSVILEPIEPGSTILLYGVPESKKEKLAQQFVLKGLSQGIPGFLVLTNQSPKSIEKMEVNKNHTASDYLISGKLRIVDIYSWRTRKVSGWIEQGSTIISESSLTSASISLVTVLECLKGLESRGVFDNLSSFLMHNSLPNLHRFTEIVVTRCRTNKATTLFLIDEQMFDPASIASIKHLMDGSIRVSIQEEEGKLIQYLRVEKMNGSNFLSKLVKI